jgi:hypothetical protein
VTLEGDMSATLSCNMFRVILPAALAMAALSGCNQPPEESRQRSHRDVQQRFAVDVPRGWAVNKDGPTTVFLMPLPGGGQSASVSVAVGGGAADKSPQELLDRLRRELAGQSFYQEHRAAVVTHPNGLRAAYIEALVDAATLDGPPRQMRLYGFVPGGGRQVVIKSLMPSGLENPQIISGTNSILDSLLVW